MARILVTPMGTWGDVLPTIPVAKELQALGHQLVYATSAPFHGALRQEGFEVRSAGPPPPDSVLPAILEQGISELERFERLIGHGELPYFRQRVEALELALADADLVLNSPWGFLATIAAERRGIPFATLTVYGGIIPSIHTAPERYSAAPAPGPQGAEENEALWRAYRYELAERLDEPLNGVRAEFGLPPKEDAALLGSRSTLLTLVLSSPAYTTPQPDWPAEIKVTGFTTYDRPAAWVEPPDLAAFLGAGEPPVVFTLGTSASIDPQQFFEIALEATVRSDRRGILLLGVPLHDLWQPRASDLTSSRVAAWSYIPLSRLLPHCSAVVHAGGFGTTAASLQAGLPAVVLPRIFDQVYNARRVAELGAGRILPWPDLSSERLTAEVDAILGQDSYAAAARVIAAAAGAEDGPRSAAAEVNALVEPGGSKGGASVV